MSKKYRGRGQGLTKTMVRLTDHDQNHLTIARWRYLNRYGLELSNSLLVSLALDALVRELEGARR